MAKTNKIKVFQNYIQHIENSIYQILLSEHILDGLKFPGTGAEIDISNTFIDLVKELGCIVDNHGWNGITAQLHDSHFCDHISAFPRLTEYLNLPGAFNFSSHIGSKTANLPEGKISQEQFNDILVKNLHQIRKTIFEATGHIPSIYGEGVYAPYFDPRTITATFLNSTLKSNGLENGLDGLVLDICHSSIAADFLANQVYHKNYSFEDYLKELDCSQIFIIHCSGGYSRSAKENGESDFNPDPHLASSLYDWEKLLLTLRYAQQVHHVSNEIAYSGHYGGKLLVKDYCSEAILTCVAVQTQNIVLIEKAKQIVSRLNSNCSNLQKIIATVKSLYEV